MILSASYVIHCVYIKTNEYVYNPRTLFYIENILSYWNLKWRKRRLLRNLEKDFPVKDVTNGQLMIFV